MGEAFDADAHPDSDLHSRDQSVTAEPKWCDSTGVEPTPYGRALIKRGVAIFDELRQGVQDIAFLTDPTAGEIRVGGSDHMVSAIVSPVIHQLAEQYSRMSFRIIIGDLRMLSRELDARRIDVVLCRLFWPLSEEYSAEVLFEDPLVVVTGANNPLARRRRIKLADLLDEPWTLQPPDNTFGSFAMDAFRAVGLDPPRITAATTSYNLRAELLATGRYLTMVPPLLGPAAAPESVAESPSGGTAEDAT